MHRSQQSEDLNKKCVYRLNFSPDLLSLLFSTNTSDALFSASVLQPTQSVSISQPGNSRINYLSVEPSILNFSPFNCL